MRVLERISVLAGKYMALIVVVIAATALFSPSTLSWIKTSWVNTLLSIVMFGMGLTLKGSDFKVVLSQPKNVFLGFLSQFTLMPGIAYLLVTVFGLPIELAVGVILVGCAPGGTSSNVMTYLAKGDVALSVCMTALSTLCAPILTPLLTLFLIGAKINVNYIGMFISIIKIVIIPIVLGIICAKLLSKITSQLTKILPLVSVTAIVMIVAAVVCVNSSKILNSGLLIFIVVICHNMLGYLTGYGLAKVCKLSPARCNTVSIEVGITVVEVVVFLVTEVVVEVVVFLIITVVEVVVFLVTEVVVFIAAGMRKKAQTKRSAVRRRGNFGKSRRLRVIYRL